MLTLLTASVPGWITQSQALLGVRPSDIVAQLEGTPLPEGASVYSTLGFLWTFPEDSADLRGLGGGVTYAWDPSLCSRLLPQFEENKGGYHIIFCDDIKAAVSRAFNAWAANNRFVKFMDVTAECELLAEQGREAMVLHPAMVKAGAGHGGCMLAEIWISALDQNASNTQGLGQARQEGSLAVATAEPHYELTTDFRYTNGDAPRVRQPDGTWGPRPVLETCVSQRLRTGGLHTLMPREANGARLGLRQMPVPSSSMPTATSCVGTSTQSSAPSFIN